VCLELAKIRWRIERDHKEIKNELGLDHYRRGPVALLEPAPLPEGFRRRGSPRAARET